MRRNKNGRRQQVLDAFRAHVEKFGAAPNCRELGDAVGMTHVGAWKHVQALIGEGLLVQMKASRRRQGLALMLREDALKVVPSEQLRGELARRGVTLDALEQRQPLWDEGRACAANHCMDRVRPGQLFCRRHWFSLPPSYRSDIMNAWSARQEKAFLEAVEAARNFLGGYETVVARVG
jgi:biotin operon repressor